MVLLIFVFDDGDVTSFVICLRLRNRWAIGVGRPFIWVEEELVAAAWVGFIGFVSLSFEGELATAVAEDDDAGCAATTVVVAVDTAFISGNKSIA